MKVGVLFFSLCLLNFNSAVAQYSEKIASGRPGQAISAQTTGKHVFQLETGFDLGGWERSVGNIKTQSMLNATLLRFGLLNKLEIHSGWEFRSDKAFIDNEEFWSASGMSFSSIGIRHNVFEGDGKKPSLGYQVSAKLNILTDDYNPDGIAPHFILTSGMSLTDKLGITLNSGINFGYESADALIYIVNLGLGLSENSFFFAEMYGDVNISESVTGGKFHPKFDFGYGFFLSDNIQLDLLGGYTWINEATEYFVSVGFSWRLNHPEEMPTD